MTIPWNIVNNTDQAFSSLSEQVGRGIRVLGEALRCFPGDTTHLQVIVDRNPRSKEFTISLNLRIPSNVLHVTESSDSLPRAIGAAARALIHLLDEDRSKRRGSRPTVRSDTDTAKTADMFSVEPFAEGLKPQTREDMIATVLDADYDRLVRFVARQLREYVVSGTVPRGAVDPRDIVDRVAEEVLRHPGLKPKRMDYPTWCTSLAAQRTRAAIQDYLEAEENTVPVDMDVEPEHDELAPDDLEPEELALNVLHDVIEPEEARVGDYIPDPKASPPDVTAAEKDMVDTLRAMARQWPKFDREVFELHYLEGLNAEDVALTLRCDGRSVESCMNRIQNTLRRRLLQITDEMGL
jgi:DNA-directed RNA polymerase specialized sigma24 family protein/ribosome-associated translation inhibitor RaiA